jgi:transcriptional regulator with XRE-family HTH domain
MDYGSQIRKRRKRLGWGQGVLAGKAAISKDTVRRVEANENVTQGTIRAIEAALDEAERDPLRHGQVAPFVTNEESPHYAPSLSIELRTLEEISTVANVAAQRIAVLVDAVQHAARTTRARDLPKPPAPPPDAHPKPPRRHR